MLVQRPIHRPSSPETEFAESMYLPLAQSRFRTLKMYMDTAGLKIQSMVTYLDNGVVIVCSKNYEHESIHISVPPVYTTEVKHKTVIIGFAVTPRSSQYPYGVDTNTAVTTSGVTTYTGLTDLYDAMFPVFDDDHATMVISNTMLIDGAVVKHDEWFTETSPPDDNYGIITWTKADDSDVVTFSWCGWPGIAIGCSRSTTINGVTELDAQTTYSTYYTPLKDHYYYRGESRYTPGKVRGVAQAEFGTVCLTQVNYVQYDFVGFADSTANPIGQDWSYDNRTVASVDPVTHQTTYTYPSPPRTPAGMYGNYFDELWITASSGVKYLVNGKTREAVSGMTGSGSNTIDTMLRIGYRVSPLSNMPAWFSSDGLTAQEDAGTWQWSYSPMTAIQADDPVGAFTSSFAARGSAGSGQYTVKGYPDPWSITGNGAWYLAYMQTQHALINFTRNESSSFTRTTTNRNQSYTVYHEYVNPDFSIQSYYLGGVYALYIQTVSGQSLEDYTWTGVDTSNGGSASVNLSARCGTVTITAVGKCSGISRTTRLTATGGGYTHTTQYILPQGSWELGCYYWVYDPATAGNPVDGVRPSTYTQTYYTCSNALAAIATYTWGC